MPYFFAHARNQDLDFDGLIDSIREAFPSTSIRKEDWYADRIAMSERIARECGKPLTPVIECLHRVAKEHGVQREIEVDIEQGLCLVGRIDRFGALFNANRAFLRREIRSLLDLLEGAGLEVETDALE